ncbi:hypothetical protein RSOLAG22IIIB_10581 [Rhizoctonia solani]|uniref:Uncharacterized protein n=1 Tax=Rhizoctonia solani TaxID=456999 RepID=A0A0K6G465_9AGAM|nr:hypothetical protein RSOLAG22IIIB_10581 [Rhizoctonia solani]
MERSTNMGMSIEESKVDVQQAIPVVDDDGLGDGILLDYLSEESEDEAEGGNTILPSYVVNNDNKSNNKNNGGRDALLVVPNPRSCYFKIAGKPDLRLQRRDYYLDSTGLRRALQEKTTIAMNFSNFSNVPVRISGPAPADSVLTPTYFGCSNWQDIVIYCDEFEKGSHNSYIMSRFLHIPGKTMYLIGQAHPNFCVTDKELREHASTVYGNAGEVPLAAIEWTDRRGPFSSDYLEVLGYHPLGFFTLYTHKNDIHYLFKRDYDSAVLGNRYMVINAMDKVRPTPNQLKRRADRATGIIPPDQTQASNWSTITIMTKDKLENIKGIPRGTSQKTVMYGHSASEVAKVFGWDREERPAGMKHRAEWLHRSAFSFGGLGVRKLMTRPDSSQQVKNLIFGSVEANTTMIRPENTMKRLAAKLGGLPWVKLNTELAQVATSVKPVAVNSLKRGGNCVWLAWELRYRMHLRTSLLSSKEGDIENELPIDPFSRRIPLRAEVKLDEMVEELWWLAKSSQLNKFK